MKESIEGINIISGKSLCFDNGREIKVSIDVAKMQQKYWTRIQKDAQRPSLAIYFELQTSANRHRSRA